MKKEAASGNRELSRSGQAIKNKGSRLNCGVRGLDEIVQKHGVSWDLCPEYHVDREERAIQIGFEFSLIGAHHHSEQILEPGCPECVRIYEDLQRIADWVAPKERRKASYDIVITDASPFYSTHRRLRPEVLVTIKVISREGLDGSVDPSEVKCLMGMKRRAEELGIPRHTGPSLSQRLRVKSIDFSVTGR